MGLSQMNMEDGLTVRTSKFRVLFVAMCDSHAGVLFCKNNEPLATILRFLKKYFCLILPTIVDNNFLLLFVFPQIVNEDVMTTINKN